MALYPYYAIEDIHIPLSEMQKHAIAKLKVLWKTYPASRVSFDLPRKIGKRKETLLTACTFFDLPIIQENGWVSKNRKNCWLFRAHGILFTIDRQTWRLLRIHTKSLKKPWNVLSQKLKSDRFQASRNHNQGLCLIFWILILKARPPEARYIWIWSNLEHAQ